MAVERVQVVVFTRSPVLGKVKTRLAATIGAEAALAAHCELLERTLTAVQASRLEAEIWLAGGDRQVPGFGTRGMTVRDQPEGDLGERMLAAVADVTGRGDGVLLIGSDCPVITADYLAAAAVELEDADVVIGPSEDGGYGLIGMQRAWPTLFTDMRWSVASVCAETRRRAAQLDLKLAELPTIWDVDTAADWRRFRALSV